MTGERTVLGPMGGQQAACASGMCQRRFESEQRMGDEGATSWTAWQACKDWTFGFGFGFGHALGQGYLRHPSFCVHTHSHTHTHTHSHTHTASTLALGQDAAASAALGSLFSAGGGPATGLSREAHLGRRSKRLALATRKNGNRAARGSQGVISARRWPMNSVLCMVLHGAVHAVAGHGPARAE